MKLKNLRKLNQTNLLWNVRELDNDNELLKNTPLFWTENNKNFKLSNYWIQMF